jgi:hypothetical protein
MPRTTQGHCEVSKPRPAPSGLPAVGGDPAAYGARSVIAGSTRQLLPSVSASTSTGGNADGNADVGCGVGADVGGGVGADVGCGVGDRFDSLLHVAATYGHAHVVHELIRVLEPKAPAPLASLLECTSSRGATPLLSASYHGHTKVGCVGSPCGRCGCRGHQPGIGTTATPCSSFARVHVRWCAHCCTTGPTRVRWIRMGWTQRSSRRPKGTRTSRRW